MSGPFVIACFATHMHAAIITDFAGTMDSVVVARLCPSPLSSPACCPAW
jgi:hypothetical protein